MKDFKILRFLDLFKPLFESFAIDYPIMRKILNVKLTLDGRRTSTVLGNQGAGRKRGEEEDKNNFIRSLGIYLLMGFFLIVFVVVGDNYLFQMNIVFGIIMFLLMTSLIADFSFVLLDVKDKEILFSKPIDDRTLNMAKILHIFIYISMIAGALAGPSLLVSFYRQGLVFGLIYLLGVILLSLFVIILTALIYLLILRVFSGEKLRDIINYVQIGLTIAITLGYQLIMRVFNIIDFDKMSFEPSLWKYFLPPIWFAAPFELIIKASRENHIIIYSILGLLVPVLSIILYVKLIPSFERGLQKLNSTDEKTRDKNRLTILISRALCKNKEERSFFKFASNMLRKERSFKLKVYPGLGMAIIFPFFMIFSMNSRELLNISNTRNYLWIYMSFTMVPAVLVSLAYSGNYKGAWIFETSPLEDRSNIYRGTLKAAIVYLFLPVFVLTSTIFLIIYKMTILDQILVVAINMFLFIIIFFRLLNKPLPFSQAFDLSESSMGAGKVFLTMGLMALFAGLHFLLTRLSYASYIYMVISSIGARFAWKKVLS